MTSPTEASRPAAGPHSAKLTGAKLTGLEAGRGVAAILVLLRHARSHCQLAYGIFPDGNLLVFGHAGVDFFFVLSGFIIFHAHRADIGRPARLGFYIQRRFTRIFPFYWIIFAAAVAEVMLSPHAKPPLGLFVRSFFLLPTDNTPIIGVAWTLQQEMIFYTIFATIILNRRLGIAAFAAWFAYMVAVWSLSLPHPPGAVDDLANYFNFEFSFGMAAAWIAGRRSAIPAPRILLLAGIVVFLAVGLAEDNGLVRNLNIFTHLGYGLSALAMVLGLVGWERRGDFAVPPLLATLGGASYAIYLTHTLLIGIIWQVMLRLHLDTALNAWGSYAVLVLGAILVAVALSFAVEKPVIALTRRWLGANKRPARLAAGT
jgi:peptidoglycan/LPS O-acetylase OafA/YrhL